MGGFFFLKGACVCRKGTETDFLRHVFFELVDKPLSRNQSAFMTVKKEGIPINAV